MISIENQKKYGVVLSYISEAVSILIAVLYTPVMLRIMGQSEFGLYQLAGSTVSYLSLLNLGFSGSYVKFYTRYRIKDDYEGIARLNALFITVFSIMGIACLVCGGVIVLNIERIFGTGLSAAELVKARVLVSVLVVSMAITFPGGVFNGYITAHERFVFQRVVGLLQKIMSPFMTLPMLLLGYGSTGMVFVSLGLTVAVISTNVYFSTRKLKMKFDFKRMQFGLLKDISSFTIFVFLNQIIDQINWNVDNLLLGRISGTAAVAIYGIGAQINAIYMQASTTVSSVFGPEIHRNANNNNNLARTMISVGRVQFSILGLVLTGFIFFGIPFITLWAGEDYKPAFYVALLLMAAEFVPLVQNTGIEVLRAKNMHRVRSVLLAVVAALNVAVSIVLIRYWGCVGAAAGTAVGLLLGNGLFINWYYHNRVGIDILAFWKELLKLVPVLLISSVFGIVYTHFVKAATWPVLLLSIAIYSAVYLAILFRIGLTPEEKKILIRSKQ